MNAGSNTGDYFSKYAANIRCNDVLEVILNSNLYIY